MGKQHIAVGSCHCPRGNDVYGDGKFRTSKESLKAQDSDIECQETAKTVRFLASLLRYDGAGVSVKQNQRTEHLRGRF